MDLFFPMIAVGIATSVHCVAMCGPLVVTYAVREEAGAPLRERLVPHLAYQSAKVASYVAVGLLLGALGSVFDIAGLRGWATLAAGLFMVLLGLNMTGRFRSLRRLALRPPRFLVNALSGLRATAKDETRRPGLSTPITFGLLTGLMPCGPLQSAQIAAAGTGSALAGATAMLGFGLGTMPLMLLFGSVSGALSARFRQRMMVVAALLVVVLGLVMMNRGAMLVGSPLTFQSAIKAASPPPPQTFTRAGDGVAEVRLVIENTRFVPDTLAIPAGEPVRLLVDRREDVACSDQLAIPQLGVLADLAPNAVTPVDVPAAEKGSYTLTCGMGMMSGSLLAGGAGGDSRWTRVPLLAAAAALLGALGYAAFAGTTRRPPEGEVRETKLPFGMSPLEALIAAALVVAASVLGLALGGVLRF